MKRLSRTLPAVLLCAFLAAAGDQPEDEPWEELFNGKNFDGWRKVDPVKVKVEDGVAVLTVPPRSGNTFDAEAQSTEITFPRSPSQWLI